MDTFYITDDRDQWLLGMVERDPIGISAGLWAAYRYDPTERCMVRLPGWWTGRRAAETHVRQSMAVAS